MSIVEESGDMLHMALAVVAQAWPYARAILVVWAVVCATRSLRRIARSLERLADHVAPQGGVNGTTEKP